MNIIKLFLQSFWEGTGIMNGLKSLKEFNRHTRGLSKAMIAFGNAGGIAFGTLGKAVAAFSTGSVWAAAAIGIKSLYDWGVKFKQKLDDAALAAKGLSREYMTLEHATKGYQQRVEEWRQKGREAAEEQKRQLKEEEELHKRILQYEKEEAEWREKDEKHIARIAALQGQISDEKLKLVEYTGDEGEKLEAQIELMEAVAARAVETAREAFERAKAEGDVNAIMERRLEMELAEQEQQTALAKAAKMREDAEKAKKDRAEAEAKAEAKKREDEAKRLNGEKSRIEELLEELVKKWQDHQDNAPRQFDDVDTSAMSYAQARHAQRDAARQQRDALSEINANINSAQQAYDRMMDDYRKYGDRAMTDDQAKKRAEERQALKDYLDKAKKDRDKITGKEAEDEEEKWKDEHRQAILDAEEKLEKINEKLSQLGLK